MIGWFVRWSWLVFWLLGSWLVCRPLMVGWLGFGLILWPWFIFRSWLVLWPWFVMGFRFWLILGLRFRFICRFRFV